MAIFLENFEMKHPATSGQIKMAKEGVWTRMFLGGGAMGRYGREFATGGILARLHVDINGIVIFFQQLPFIVKPNIVFLMWDDVMYSKEHSKSYFNPFELRRCRYHVYQIEREDIRVGFNDKTIEKYAVFFIGANKMSSNYELAS